MEMNFFKRNIEDNIPIFGVQDDFIISKRGDLTVGWELTLPVAYNMLEEEYDDISRCWASAVKVLPPWCVVHRQDFFSYETYEAQHEIRFLARNFERHHSGKKYLVHKSRLFLTFSTKTRVNNLNSHCGLFQLMTFKPRAIKRAQVEEYASKANEFINIVTRSKKISARRLVDFDYVGTDTKPGVIQEYMMLGNKNGLLSDIKLSPDEVQVDDRHLISFAINEVEILPSFVTNTSRVESMSGTESRVFLSTGAGLGVLLDCNHILNQYVVTLPQEATIHNLDAKRKRMESGSLRGADNRVGAEEITEFIEDIQKESRIVVKTHCNVLAFGDVSQRNELKSKVSTALSNMNVLATVNIFDTPVLYYSAIPGGESELGSDNLMTMELDAALSLGCYETFEGDVAGGNFRTVDAIRKVPVTIDLQKKARDLGWIDNYNAFVLGGSGSGKSFFTNHYLRNCYDHGESIFIIDVGGSYEGVTNVINEESYGRDGAYYSWDKEHPLSFNPFIGYDRWLDAKGQLNIDEPGLNAFVASLVTMWTPANGWNDDMKIVLNKIVSDFVVYDMRGRNGKGRPIFDDFCRFVDTEVKSQIVADKYFCGGVSVGTRRFDIDSFLLSLNSYRKDGDCGFLLNDPNPKDLFTNRWTVFEVDKLAQTEKSNPKFYALVILWIMNSFDMKMRANPEFKVLCIEEAWKAIANEAMSNYIAALFKTARKFNCSAMVVTQQISDIMSSNVIRDTILKNSSIRIILDQSANQKNFDDIQNLLGLSEIDKNLCLAVNRSLSSKDKFKQVFISWGTKKRGLYNTEVSLEEALAYESEKEKKRPLFVEAHKRGSMIEAINAAAVVIREGLKKVA